MNAGYGIILLLLIFSIHSTISANRQLSLVIAVWRHGDRTPVELYPKIGAQNAQDSWKRGLGQLTAEGTRQAFELGKVLRERYETFLPELYHFDTANFYSTDYDRTIMTAQAVTAGMYKPPQVWYNGSGSDRERILAQNWSPIPVHVNHPTDDPIHGTSSCNTNIEYDPVIIKSTPEYVQHGASLEFACTQTGLDCNQPDSIIKIYDTIFVEHAYHLRDKSVHGWPAWMNETIFNSLGIMHNVAWESLVSTVDRRRQMGGTLLNFILNKMKKHNPTDPLKFYGASGHDHTVLSQLSLIRDSSDGLVQPAYTSCLLYELYSDDTVEIYYRNGTHGIEKLYVTGCAYPCALTEFERIMSGRSLPICTVSTIVESVCGYAKVHSLMVVLSSMLIVILLITISCYVYRRAMMAQKKLDNAVRYMQIGNDGAILLSDDSEDEQDSGRM